MWYNICIMKRIIFILTLFLLFINTAVFAAQTTVTKEITATASDGFTLKGYLEYPKIKNQKEFKTVVLLHSLGYSSEWWGSLPKDLLNQGYAVLRIDLRGHGKSVYNAKLVRTSWASLTNNAYAKYPDDVIKVIEQVKSENSKKVFFNNWAIVGSDIGASTAILASDKIGYKPKTLVLLSPVVQTKGLYVPVVLANLNKIDVFSISGTNDISGHNAQDYLKKFAQSTFATYTSDARSSGMLMLKNDASLSRVITSWIGEYLK